MVRSYAAEAAMRFTVMTYNLLYAFHERKGNAMIRLDRRAHAARDVVRAEAPDVLALTEATYIAHRGRQHRPDYQRMFGLEHIFSGGYQADWGNCLLSRFPIVRAEYVPLNRTPKGTTPSAIRAVLDIEGIHVHVDVVHPSPHTSEEARVEAFQPLLATMQPPYLMLGDFNALSDEDPYEEAALIEQMRPYIPRPESLAALMLNRKLIASIRAAGLRDTLPAEHRTHTIPTKLDRPHATQGAQLRIDYIFASPEFRVERAAIIKTPATELASDHYPMLAVLELQDLPAQEPQDPPAQEPQDPPAQEPQDPPAQEDGGLR